MEIGRNKEAAGNGALYAWTRSVWDTSAWGLVNSGVIKIETEKGGLLREKLPAARQTEIAEKFSVPELKGMQLHAGDRMSSTGLTHRRLVSRMVLKERNPAYGDLSDAKRRSNVTAKKQRGQATRRAKKGNSPMNPTRVSLDFRANPPLEAFVSVVYKGLSLFPGRQSRFSRGQDLPCRHWRSRREEVTSIAN